MRRSFGGGGRGMGGGGGSGSMLWSVGRAVTRAGVAANGGALQDSLSSTCTSPTSSKQTQKPTSSNILSLSSTTTIPFSSSNVPMSVVSSGPTWPTFSSQCGDFELVSVDGSSEDEICLFDDFVLGSVPSKDEVQNTVSALQQVFEPASYSQLVRDRFPSNLDKNGADQISGHTGLVHRLSSVGSELDWLEPSLHLCNSSTLQQPHGFNRVYDAFHLLQTEPSVQRMVISLSSDKAVWDAVLNNEVVRELKESYYAAERNSPGSSDETSGDTNSATKFVKWILNNTKAKFMDVMEKITKLVNELFKLPGEEKTAAGARDPFEERLRSSFLLSVVVLLIVVVTRASNA